MKPKFHSFLRKALPTLIIIPAMNTLASAATISADGLGNVLVTTGYNQPATVLASGGSTSPNWVTIETGATLTGDSVLQNGVVISASQYTVDNSGTIKVAQIGISSSNAANINNMEGALIQGGNDAINFSSGVTGGSVTNNGIISGVTGTYSDGIRGRDNLAVYNKTNYDIDDIAISGGSISGIQYGIYAGSDVTVVNENLASISAAREDAIHFTGDGGTVTNNGNITAIGASGGGSPDGIRGRTGLTVYNNTNFADTGNITTLVSTAVSGGSIAGGINGIYADGNLSVRNEYLASISGASGAGIRASSNAQIYNGSGDTGGTITGGQDGINAGANLYLDNSYGGNITGTNNDGVIAGGCPISGALGANITNYGLIKGDQDGINLYFHSHGASGGGDSYIYNEGTITGTNSDGIQGDVLVQTIDNYGTINGNTSASPGNGGAIRLYGGDDVINLYQGSIINGLVCGGSGGEDLLHFGVESNHPYSDVNIIHGAVTEMETIIKDGESVAFIGGVDESYEVEANVIRVNEGALYMNVGNMDVSGLLAASSSAGLHAVYGGNTQIFVDGGEVGGTGVWDADIEIYNGGAISAGAAPIYLTDENPNDSVGLLTINGSVTHSYGDFVEAAKATTFEAPIMDQSTYIVENIIPQTPIIDGINSDLIVHHGYDNYSPKNTVDLQVAQTGNVYDLTGAKVLLAPTNTVETITDGKYTIIDSDEPLAGFDLMDQTVGVFVDGEILNNTVLGNYFSALSTEGPTGSSGGAGASISESVIAAAPPIEIVDDSNLVVTVDHNYAGLPGLTDNESALGGAIDNSVNNPDEDIQKFIAQLDLLDLGLVQDTLTSLNPEVYMNQVSAILSSDYRLHRMTQEHLAAIRSGSTVTYTAPAAPSAKGEAVTAPTVTTTSSKANAWGAFSMDWQDYTSDHSVNDFDGDTFAFTAGFDWRIASNLVLGIVLDGSSGSYDGSHSSSSDIDSFRSAIYGTWGESMGLYSDALIGFGTHDMDLKRDLGGLLSGFDADGSNDATSFQALWTIGYTMGDATIKHGPWVGLEYQIVNVDSFKESGPLPVSMEGYDVDSLRGLIGYRVNGTFDKFRPYAMVAYAQEFEGDSTTATAKFGSAKFDVTGAQQSSAILLSIGTGYAVTDSLTVDIGYRGEIAVGGEGMDSNGGSIGVNYSF